MLFVSQPVHEAKYKVLARPWIRVTSVLVTVTTLIWAQTTSVPVDSEIPSPYKLIWMMGTWLASSIVTLLGAAKYLHSELKAANEKVIAAHQQMNAQTIAHEQKSWERITPVLAAFQGICMRLDDLTKTIDQMASQQASKSRQL